MTPPIAARLTGHHQVMVESGAGSAAGFTDHAYAEAGAEIVDDPYSADLAAVTVLEDAHVDRLRPGTAVVGLLDPWGRPERISRLAERQITALAFEAVPRTTRAQSMDVLSSQATVLGYQAVLEAATRLPKFFPMLTTAAGTIRPAKVIVLGAGVAGLQAIATARRLGAVVTAYDVRAAAAEQVESLGAKFIELDLPAQDASTSGGYARALDESDQRRLLEALETHVVTNDAVVTTAAIPGRRAPLLVTASMVGGLAPGSVIVDGAAATGGNCELTVAGSESTVEGVTILGYTDLPSRTAYHASEMYARNVFELLRVVAPEGSLDPNYDDDIIAAVTVAADGAIRDSRVREALGQTPTGEDG